MEQKAKVSVSCSRHPKFFAPAPELFGPLKNYAPLHFLYLLVAIQNMSVEWELKFQAPAPPCKIFRLRFRAQTPQPCLEQATYFCTVWKEAYKRVVWLSQWFPTRVPFTVLEGSASSDVFWIHHQKYILKMSSNHKENLCGFATGCRKL